MSTTQVVKVVPAEVLDLEPTQLVDRAFKIATALATIVRAGNLYCVINGEEFVRVDGWIAMGSLLGLTPVVTDVHALEDGGFEAAVEIRSRSGVVYASASAICGMDEKRWAAVPAFSRRSMAITRAIGKAYRISFSWVMRLAGMSATPAEDMPAYAPGANSREVRQDQPPHPADDPARRENGETYDPFSKRWTKKANENNGIWNGRWPRRDG